MYEDVFKNMNEEVKFTFIINTYLLLCLYLTEDDIEKIIQYYNIKISKDKTDKNSIKDFLSEFNLAKKDINKLHGFINKCENIMPLWIYNGYSKNEVKKMKEKLNKKDYSKLAITI